MCVCKAHSGPQGQILHCGHAPGALPWSPCLLSLSLSLQKRPLIPLHPSQACLPFSDPTQMALKSLSCTFRVTCYSSEPWNCLLDLRSIPPSFHHSRLWNSYNIPRTVLGPGETAVDTQHTEKDNTTELRQFTFLWGRGGAMGTTESSGS